MNAYMLLTFLELIFADKNDATSAVMVTTTTAYTSTICNSHCNGTYRKETEHLFDGSIDDRLVLTPIKDLSPEHGRSELDFNAGIHSKLPARNDKRMGQNKETEEVTPKPYVDPNFYKNYFRKNSQSFAKISFLLYCLVLK